MSSPSSKRPVSRFRRGAFSALSPHALVIIEGTRFVGPPPADGRHRRIHGVGALAVRWLLGNGFEVAWSWDRVMLLVRGSRGRCEIEVVEPSAAAARPLRILWCANGPWMPTGYGVQTRLFAPLIAKSGHAIALQASPGLIGGPITWNGLPVYPGSSHPFGLDWMTAHAAHFGADLVIFHSDAWVLDFGLIGRENRLVPWFPVDSDPIPDQVADRLRRSWRAIAFSRFAQQQAASVGIDADYVPLGVDTAAYQPLDQRASREKFGMPKDAFVVGMVAMNKEIPSRKSFPQVLQAFAEFRARHRDAHLFLHTQPRGLGGRHGVDLPGLARALGIEDCVQFASEYVVMMGARDTEMAALYSAFDVLIAPSMGEGFGAPIVEAQACGRPVITGGWTAMPEVCFAGVQISLRDADAHATGLNSWQFAPRAGAILEALEDVRRRQGAPGLDAETARAGALAFDAALIFERYWLPALQQLSHALVAQEGSRTSREQGVSR